LNAAVVQVMVLYLEGIARSVNLIWPPCDHPVWPTPW
jgi:hypothetical protein